MISLRSTVQIKHWVVVFAGALFALLVWGIMTLQFRYVVVISVGIVMISVAMIAIRNIEDFLVYALVFNIPFSIFAKWLFSHRLAFPARGISLGLAEVLILMSYIVWFSQIFIARTKPLPRLQKVDYFILLFVFTQLISLIGAPDKLQGTFDIIFNIKHILIYFFIAHSVKRRNLRWIVVFLLFAIIFESSIALFERATGIVSIGTSKGNVEAASFNTQPSYPGLEYATRVSGTTVDPHALGLYYAMILPIPFVLLMMRFLRPLIRFGLLSILIIGIIGLIMTYARSGWLSFAISSIFAIGVIIFSWKQSEALPIAIFILLATILLCPQIYRILYERTFKAPTGGIKVRIESAQTALDIWCQHFFFGYGPGSYLDAIDDPDVKLVGQYHRIKERPVHNSFFCTAAELGLFGVISFFGIIFIAMSQCWKMLRCSDFMIRGLALAVLAGFMAYLVDGLTNMMFRETVPYAQLWTYIALAMALRRLVNEQTLTWISHVR